jgi:hypothetical protein
MPKRRIHHEIDEATELSSRYGADYAEEALRRPKADRSPVTSVRRSIDLSPTGRLTSEYFTPRIQSKPIAVAIGRRVLQPNSSVLESLASRSRTKAVEAGLQPKKVPPVFALRYTTTYAPAEADDVFTVIEQHSTEFRAMQGFCEHEIAVNGLVAAKRSSSSVFVNYTVAEPATAIDGLFAERGLVRQFGAGGSNDYSSPLHIRLLEAKGDYEQTEAFLANVSDLISGMDAVPVKLDRLNLVLNSPRYA